jgi:hypothetical protein
MAQTKRKRRSKHRGTAAGRVEARGRTSRPASPQERKKQTREVARQARLNKQPTWQSAITRAALATGFMLLMLLVLTKGRILASLAFAVFAFVLYVPSGYYLESYLWRRRMRKQAAGQAQR